MSKYQFALAKNEQRIHISDAVSGKQGYVCPYCGCEMIARKGAVREHHFAHSVDSRCDEWYGNKGEWHIQMQNMFPKETQEVILEVNGEKHIADICIEKLNGQKLVIEFQSSPLSQTEFVRRTQFWRNNNAEVIWVFDVRDKDVREIPKSRTGIEAAYRWRHAFSTIGDSVPDNATVFFYMNPLINTFFYVSENRFTDGDILVGAGKVRSAPYFMKLTGRSVHIPDAFTDYGRSYNYNASGYPIVCGQRYYDFLGYVKKRFDILDSSQIKDNTGSFVMAFVMKVPSFAIWHATKATDFKEAYEDPNGISLYINDVSTGTWRQLIYHVNERAGNLKEVKRIWLASSPAI